MSIEKELFWRPQVLRHTRPNEMYAIHEVYFSDYGKSWGPTESALSFRYSSVQELRKSLEEFLESNLTLLKCGDKGYEYDKEDVCSLAKAY